MQIISAHPSFSKITQTIQEEQAKALVKGEEADIFGAISKIHPSTDDIELFIKPASLAKLASTLQQERQSLEAGRQLLQARQGVLGVMIEIE